MNKLKAIGCKLFEATVQNTGWPIDGHKVITAIWPYSPSGHHLFTWYKADDEVMAKTMYQSMVDADISIYNSWDEFKAAWDAETWEAPGAFCFTPKQLTNIQPVPDDWMKDKQ